MLKAIHLVTASVFAALGMLHAAAATPELGPDDLPRFPPLEPDEALASFEVREGFRLELAASEPQVMDPVAISFDADGRLYVVEMRDYSERRPERLGRVRLLEDRDLDGRYETSSAFLDDLPWPTAIMCWDGGVFVGTTPDIIYARDEDGDGRAEVRETVFTGLASAFAPYATNQLNVQAMMNSFQWGLDCRIHGSASLSGGSVRLVDSAFTRAWRRRAGVTDLESGFGPLELRGQDFSFDPRTLSMRAESGGGQHGMSFDSLGRKFVCSNSDHLQFVRYEPRHALADTTQTLPPARVSIAADGPAAEVFRISPEEPWRVVRTRWRVAGLASGPIEGGGRASGYFTGATGATIYRGDAYPPEFAENAFIADCGSNLIHRKKLREEGCELIGERPADEMNREFAASRDTWFRPVQFANAPDGCLWVIDMYREIIEHPWSLPPNLKKRLDLNAGNDRGRLYRIAPESGARIGPVALSRLSTAELVKVLEHPNGWHRDTASRLLCQRRDPAAVEPLRQLVRRGASEFGRIHALYVLDALSALEVADLEAATRDRSPSVRRHSVRLTELRYGGGRAPEVLATRWMRLADNDDPFLRLQIALAQLTTQVDGEPRLIETLARRSNGRRGESLIVDAALAAGAEDAARLFRSLAAAGRERPMEVLSRLAEIIGRRSRPAEIAQTLAELAAWTDAADAVSLAAQVLSGGADVGGADAGGSVRDSVRRLSSMASSVLQAALSRGTEADRDSVFGAIRFLGATKQAVARDALIELLAATTAPEVQSAVARALASGFAVEAAPRVFAEWARLRGEARQEFLEGLTRGGAGIEALLKALEENRISPRDFAAAQLQRLRGVGDVRQRERVVKLLGPPPASRADALAHALGALDLAGDAARGLKIYEAQCASCHRLGGAGHAVGPDLESVRSQPPEKLLVAIVDPNREVAPNYFATTVETRDGESYSGILVAESPSGVVLRQASGLEQRIDRADIATMRTDGRSLMPEGFEGTMTLQEIADLIQCVLKGGDL